MADRPSSKAVSTLPTSSNKRNGEFTILTTATILASLPLVLAVCLNFKNWSKSNTFSPRSASWQLTLPHVLDDGKSTFESLVNDIFPSGYVHKSEHLSMEEFKGGENGETKGRRLVWGVVESKTQRSQTWLQKIPRKSGYLLRAERVEELLEEERDGKVVTQYRTWITVGGVLAFMMQKKKYTLVWALWKWSDGLRRFFEPEG